MTFLEMSYNLTISRFCNQQVLRLHGFFVFLWEKFPHGNTSKSTSPASSTASFHFVLLHPLVLVVFLVFLLLYTFCFPTTTAASFPPEPSPPSSTTLLTILQPLLAPPDFPPPSPPTQPLPPKKRQMPYYQNTCATTLNAISELHQHYLAILCFRCYCFILYNTTSLGVMSQVSTQWTIDYMCA